MARKVTKPTIEEVHGAYQELYNDLNKGYWVASTIEAKDRIHGLTDIIFDILTALNRSDISARTEEFKKMKGTIDSLNKKLDELKQEIDKVIHAMKTAVEVAKAIDKALELTSKFLG